MLSCLVLAACARPSANASSHPTRSPEQIGAPSLESSHTSARVRSVVISAAAGEVFRPSRFLRGRDHLLTARQAWLRWANSLGGRHPNIPTGVTVRYGLLTLPPQYGNRPVYGYVEKQKRRCVTTVPPAAPGQCREWIFLDAKSGRELDWTFQRVSHRPVERPDLPLTCRHGAARSWPIRSRCAARTVSWFWARTGFLPLLLDVATERR